MTIVLSSSPFIVRLGQVLLAAGVVGLLAFLAIDLLWPPHIPSDLREDRFRLSTAPRLAARLRAPTYLLLGDGAVPAHIETFEYIPSAAQRERLLSLKPGTEVTVLRPNTGSTWLGPYSIVALRAGGQDLLLPQDVVAAHNARMRDALVVLLCIALAGALLLLARRVLGKVPNAA